VDTERLIRDVVKSVVKKLEEVPQSNTADAQLSTVKEPGQKAGAEYAKTSGQDKKIVCGVSVRHVHLSREHLDILYGKDYKPKIFRELYQPGTYAYEEAVTIVGPKLNAIQNVRILGPLRNKTQVELAKTDCVILGINAPVRRSGDLKGSASVVLIGPKGVVFLNEGVIRANRHIHLDTEDASYFGIKDNEEVDVRIGGPKGLTFNNVQVRISPDFKSEMHVDTDDANAADIANGTLVEIVDASCITSILTQVADSNHTPPSIPDGSFASEITDPNILKSISVFSPLEGKGILDSKSASRQNLTDSQSGSRKIVITVEDLDSYRESGIKLTSNTILSPLARDEAVKRGIKIM